MPVPTNLTPATAIVIAALPYTTTQDVAFGGVVYSVWYQFTAPDDYVYGVYGYGDFFLHFVETEVYTLVAGSPVSYLGLGANNRDDRPVYFPVTAGETYYFKFAEDSDPSASPAIATILVQRAPEGTISEGDLIVPDEIAGFPAAVLSPSTGEVVAFITTLPDSVAGDVRDDGVFLLDNRTVQNLELFGSDFAQLATVPFAWTGAYPIVRTCWPSGVFYVCNRVADAPGPTDFPIIRTVDGTGAFGPTTWTLPQTGLVSMAASNDETILYNAGQGFDVFADGAPVKQYDLVGAVMGTDLAAGVTNYAPRSLLVLDDDSILVLYGKRTVTIDAFIRRYSPAGAILNTYALGETIVTGFASNYLFRPVASDTTSFWVRSHPRVALQFNTTRHTQIRISDGVVLASVDTPEFTAGVMTGGGVSVTTDYYGDSPSCPVFLVPVPPGPPVPPNTLIAVAGSYSIGGAPATLIYSAAPPDFGLQTVPMRRLRRAPHLADEQRWLTYDRFQLDLQTGVGLSSGQGEDPQIMLRWSNDGGHTWSNEHWVSAGRMGATKTRAIWRQLGRARTRTFEVVVSDPVAYFLAAAYVQVSPGDGT